MKRKVVYFTRTGTCKRIAEMIARSLSLDLVQLRDNQRWDGFFGYWKAGFFASTNRDVKIEVLGDLSDAEEVSLLPRFGLVRSCLQRKRSYKLFLETRFI